MKTTTNVQTAAYPYSAIISTAMIWLRATLIIIVFTISWQLLGSQPISQADRVIVAGNVTSVWVADAAVRKIYNAKYNNTTPVGVWEIEVPYGPGEKFNMYVYMEKKNDCPDGESRANVPISLNSDTGNSALIAFIVNKKWDDAKKGNPPQMVFLRFLGQKKNAPTPKL